MNLNEMLAAEAKRLGYNQPTAAPDRPAPPRLSVVTDIDNDRARRWLDAKIRNVTDALAAMPPNSGRNAALNSAALNIGRYTPKWLSEQDVHDHLLDACRRNGLLDEDGHNQCEKSINSGLRKASEAERRDPPISDDTTVDDWLATLPDTPKKYTAEEAQQTPWEAPHSLALTVPPFPTHALGWMQKPVEALADELQTPVDIAGMLLLAAIATAVRGRAQVNITPRWHEPLNLYIAVIAGAGETKSPALAVISGPVRQLEAQLQETHRPTFLADEQRKRIQKSRMDKAEKAAANANADRGEKEVEATEERQRYEAIDPYLPRLLAADTTPEGLVQLLAQQRGVLAVLSAEGGLFDTLAGGRYSSGMANLDAVLQAHDGREPILVDRKGSPPVRVDRPTLTLGLAVQPQVLQAVGKSDAAVGRGFLARFLFSVPDTLVGSRRVTRPGAEADFDAFQKVVVGVDSILSRGSGGIGDHSLRVDLELSSSSLDLFYGYRESLEPRRHPRTGDLAGIRAWANKLDGQIARLAGLLQLIYLAEGPQSPQNPVTIQADTLKAATDLADYLIGHAVAAHLLIAGDALAASDTALQLLGWIQANGLAEFTIRDAQQALKRRVDFKHVDAVKEAAAVLVQHGYLRQLKPDPGPGRPTEKFLVNPLEPT